MRIIDCHCHVMPEEVLKDLPRFASVDNHFGALVTTKGARFCSGEDLLREMDASDIGQAVIFGFSSEDQGFNRAQNDYVMSLSREHPDRFIPFGVLCPKGKGYLEEAERCVAGGICGFGEIFPAGHGFSLDGKDAKALAGLCKEAGLPLLIHVNEQVGHDYPGKGDVGPGHACRFAKDNPGLTVIFAHFGGGLPFYWAMPEVRALEDVYYDTAAQPLLYKPEVYSWLKSAGALDKILLGSDYPLLSCARYLRDMEKSGLDKDDIQKVVRDNAVSLLGRFFLRDNKGN